MGMETNAPHKASPSDVTDEEWAFVVPYLMLLRPDAPQRVHDLRDGAPWRYLPTTFPPGAAVSQQTQRWIAAGVFADMVHDPRVLLRWLQTGPPARRRRCSAAGPASRRPNAGTGRAMTAPGGAKAARSSSRSTRWAICWPCL